MGNIQIKDAELIPIGLCDYDTIINTIIGSQALTESELEGIVKDEIKDNSKGKLIRLGSIKAKKNKELPNGEAKFTITRTIINLPSEYWLTMEEGDFYIETEFGRVKSPIFQDKNGNHYKFIELLYNNKNASYKDLSRLLGSEFSPPIIHKTSQIVTQINSRFRIYFGSINNEVLITSNSQSPYNVHKGKKVYTLKTGSKKESI